MQGMERQWQHIAIAVQVAASWVIQQPLGLHGTERVLAWCRATGSGVHESGVTHAGSSLLKVTQQRWDNSSASFFSTFGLPPYTLSCDKFEDIRVMRRCRTEHASASCRAKPQEVMKLTRRHSSKLLIRQLHSPCQHYITGVIRRQTLQVKWKIGTRSSLWSRDPAHTVSPVLVIIIGKMPHRCSTSHHTVTCRRH